ncbi:MAG: DNA repair protein RecO [Pyrinomonadaceae bacterium]
MGLVETEAIVLRTYNLAEADKIAVCLTRGGGVRRGVAQGARRLKSRFGAGLEPGTEIRLSYYEKEGRELVSIKQTEIHRSRFNLAQESGTLTALTYLCELVLEFAPPHEPNETMYRLVNASLESLATTPHQAEALLRYFEIWMLQIAGFLPELRVCVECGQPLDDKRKSYLNAENRVRCADCDRNSGTPVSAEARAQIKGARRMPPAEFVQRWEQAPATIRTEMARLTAQLIERALERQLRVGEKGRILRHRRAAPGETSPDDQAG